MKREKKDTERLTLSEAEISMVTEGMKAWDKACKAGGNPTWFKVLPAVYAAMKAVDPTLQPKGPEAAA